MKKLFLSMMLCAAACIITGCNGFKSEEKSLSGNLVSFTSQAENQQILLGVKDKQTGRVIVTPAVYQSITADDNVIICKVSDLESEAYKVKDGDPIGRGSFELFTKMPIGNAYLGTNYKTNTYYFPAQDEVLAVKTSMMGLKQLFLRTGDGQWEVRDYDGNLLWKTSGVIKNRHFWIVQDIKAPEETFYIAVTGEKNPACILYDHNGKVIKELNASKWRRTQKKFQNAKELDKGTTFVQFERIKNF